MADAMINSRFLVQIIWEMDIIQIVQTRNILGKEAKEFKFVTWCIWLIYLRMPGRSWYRKCMAQERILYQRYRFRGRKCVGMENFTFEEVKKEKRKTNKGRLLIRKEKDQFFFKGTIRKQACRKGSDEKLDERKKHKRKQFYGEASGQLNRTLQVNKVG